jgi:hypothetical protein
MVDGLKAGYPMEKGAMRNFLHRLQPASEFELQGLSLRLPNNTCLAVMSPIFGEMQVSENAQRKKQKVQVQAGEESAPGLIF